MTALFVYTAWGRLDDVDNVYDVDDVDDSDDVDDFVDDDVD
jgi:hypothetical protein